MLQDSNATVANLFSFYGFRGFLRENENDLFLRLHVLDCGQAITCMYRSLDDCVGPYGHDRCRLPTNPGRALCVAFQSLYYLADDSNICPDDLIKEVSTFARHCLCAEHAERAENVSGLAERLFLAVERWQCRRVFMDEPDGTPATPPEERAGASRLSQFFIRVPNRSPRRRPKFRSRDIELELEIDCWGIPHEKRPRVADWLRPMPISTPSQRTQRLERSAAPGAETESIDRTPTTHRSHYQQFKDRAKSAVDKIANNAS